MAETEAPLELQSGKLCRANNLLSAKSKLGKEIKESVGRGNLQNERFKLLLNSLQNQKLVGMDSNKAAIKKCNN